MNQNPLEHIAVRTVQRLQHQRFLDHPQASSPYVKPWLRWGGRACGRKTVEVLGGTRFDVFWFWGRGRDVTLRTTERKRVRHEFLHLEHERFRSEK